MRHALLVAASCLALAAGPALAQAPAPPPAVQAFVTGQIAAPITYSGPIALGQAVPGAVPWMSIPNFPQYAWAYLNGLRVVVDINTRVVVAIY